jgi:vacuolar-type H+-ATPase subunit H
MYRCSRELDPGVADELFRSLSGVVTGVAGLRPVAGQFHIGQSKEAALVLDVRDFLSRFRPAGAPGAGRTAVPADQRRELESELVPVMMLLDGPSADCADIVLAAQLDAEQIIDAARHEADNILSSAHQQAEASAAELLQNANRAARTEAAIMVARGMAESGAIRQRVTERLPALTDRAVELVRHLADPGSAAESPRLPAQDGPADQPGQLS